MYDEVEENLNDYDSFIRFICNDRLDIGISKDLLIQH